LISADDAVFPLSEMVWPAALEMIDTMSGKTVELTVRDDDLDLIHVVNAAGFEVRDQYFETWMQSEECPEVTPLLAGFELVARSDRSSEPHHMIRRNGIAVAERLAECPLYRADLDLAIYSGDGELAAYCLFWADPVTGVGLVEPMRTEERFQQMGLGRHVLTAGLERLCAQGCSRLKVSYEEQNEAARRLYLGAGFRAYSSSHTYERTV
jgi:RimJ/RimL family protein N-acetyltransferase